MDDQMIASLAKARRLVDTLGTEPLEKTMWGSPAGKKRLSKRLVAMLPPHSVYTEAFVGSGAVLFAKEPVATEAINDGDPEIAAAYSAIKRLQKGDLERLARMNWTGDKATFKRLRDTKPTADVEKLHKFLYLSHFAYGKLRGKSFSPSTQGKVARTPDRVAEFGPRLRRVKVFSGDYEPVVRKFDAKEAVHFLDPPYTGYNVEVGEGDFDEQRFFRMLKALKGKFLITYGTRGKLPGLVKAEGYNIKKIRTPRTIRTMRGVGGSSMLTQLVVSNYDIAQKRWSELASDGVEIDEDLEERGRVSARVTGCPAIAPAAGERAVPTPEETPAHDVTEPSADPLPSAASEHGPNGGDDVAGRAFAKAIPLLKGVDPDDERYVLGIVLEPETVDAQGDIYSPAEIRKAAHTFMEEFRGIGLMHKLRVNDGVKILENYLAPAAFKAGDVEVKKGTWLLAVRVVSDALWKDVQAGELTGFSIGGSARRVPEAEGSGAGA